MERSSIETVNKALAELRAGRMVILVDDEDRENEGDLTMAAEKATPEAINFMAREGRGLICLTLTEEMVKKLQLPMMVERNTSQHGTPFTVSIEARVGVTTGISAADRATTILTAVADDARPSDLVQPGHIFPLRAKRGGVMVRAGQTEGSVDLARLAGLKTAGVICEIMKEDGSMARMPDLEKFAKKHELVIVSIADIVNYRMQRESFVHRELDGTMSTEVGGDFRTVIYSNEVDNHQHIALVKGEIHRDDSVLVRVQKACLPGDVFGSFCCKCGIMLRNSLKMIDKEGKGVLLYLRTKARSDLTKEFESHVLCKPEEKHENSEERIKQIFRKHGIGTQILADLGLRKIRLMTNNPKRMIGLSGFGLEVVEIVPILTEDENRATEPCLKCDHEYKEGNMPFGTDI